MLSGEILNNVHITINNLFYLFHYSSIYNIHFIIINFMLNFNNYAINFKVLNISEFIYN